MAEQDPQIRLGWLTLSTAGDARRSSITGSTLAGPNGSGQFLWVYMSTSADLQFSLGSSAFTPSTLTPVVGILQDTPGPGLAGSICVFGVTKYVAGLAITRGGLLQASSTLGGVLTPYLQGNGPPLGYALDSPAATAVGTMMLFGAAHGGFST